MNKPIQIECVYKTHRTTIDGGIALTLDLPSVEADNINELFKLSGKLLHIVIMTDAQLNRSKIAIVEND